MLILEKIKSSTFDLNNFNNSFSTNEKEEIMVILRYEFIKFMACSELCVNKELLDKILFLKKFIECMGMPDDFIREQLNIMIAFCNDDIDSDIQVDYCNGNL